MQFSHWIVNLNNVQKVQVRINNVGGAYIYLMDDMNFNRFRMGSGATGHGGFYNSGTAELKPLNGGKWNVVVYARQGSFGMVSATVYVI